MLSRPRSGCRWPCRFAIAAVGLGILYLLVVWNLPLSPGNRIYEVKTGTSMRALTDQLYQDGVLPDRHTLVWLALLRRDHRRIHAGEYRFEAGISEAGILDKLVAGKCVSYPFLIPDGWTFKEILQALAAAPKLHHTIQGLSPAQVMTRLGHEGLYPEGRFFPDTYLYTAETTDIEILREAFDKMQRVLAREWASRDSGLPYKDPYQALIMASIIEKETGAPKERPEIAGVFINRLHKHMRLQTDPTVIYGMGDAYHGDLRKIDLRRDTPYNTYTRGGLPPTPIAMPGEAAIHASLHPANTQALYFVARGDGTHVFSDTLEEHNRAVAFYQKNPVERQKEEKKEEERMKRDQ
jgi:UPF0755 protein